MLKWTLQKIVGTKNQREVKRLRPVAEQINKLEEALQNEPETVLVEKTRAWQEKLHRFLPLQTPTKRTIEQLEPEALADLGRYVSERIEALRPDFPNLPKVSDSPESIDEAKKAFNNIEDQFPKLREKYLNEILPEAYAVVKNGARRMCGQTIDVADQQILWEMVHFDVQLVGGIGLHRGLIAEMQTGEGKTLTATLPVYLNALTGMGVHVITVNDYLAKRDSEWMGSLYRYLGLTVGCIQNSQPPHERRDQYYSDITYGTNAEFGFDYLRDNGMASSADQQVQRGHYFSIIDEVDSILIDEARTPLIISGPSTVATSTDKYVQYKGHIEQLVKKQNALCADLATQAQKQLDANEPEEAGRTLFKLKLAQPRNRQFMRFMEDPDTRRIVEKAELAMYQDTQKKDLFTAKEELYYTIDEKGHDADLMEMAREFLSPGDPESFVLPDLAGAYADIDAKLDLDDETRAKLKEEVTIKLDEQGEKCTSSPSCSKPIASTRKTSNTSFKTTKWSSSTKTLVAKCLVAAGPMDSTKPSKPRKTAKSKPKRKPTPPSPSRTTFASTPSWLA